MFKENGFGERFLKAYNKAPKRRKERFSYSSFSNKYPLAAVQYVFATQYQKRRVYMLKARYSAQYYFKYPEIKTIDEFVELLLKQDDVVLENDFDKTRPINIDEN